MGFIQYLVSEVCFTAQTRDAVVERIGRMTVLCPRATHVGVVPRDIVVGVREIGRASCRERVCAIV